MSEHMTTQEARRVLNLFKQLAEEGTCYSEALGMGISALRASIPHVLTLPEARTMEPHTAIYAEFLNHPDVITGPYAVGTILNKGGFPAYGKTVRWWTAWPSEELRKATEWEASK